MVSMNIAPQECLQTLQTHLLPGRGLSYNYHCFLGAK